MVIQNEKYRLGFKFFEAGYVYANMPDDPNITLDEQIAIAKEKIDFKELEKEFFKAIREILES